MWVIGGLESQGATKERLVLALIVRLQGRAAPEGRRAHLSPTHSAMLSAAQHTHYHRQPPYVGEDAIVAQSPVCIVAHIL